MNEDYFGPSPERKELTEEQACAAMDKIRLALRQGMGRQLPSVPSLVKKAKHAAKNAASPRIKIGYLSHAIKRLEFHRDKVQALYTSNVATSTDIDDLEYLSAYMAEANEAIRGLALLIERIQLELEARADSKAIAVSHAAPKGKGSPSRHTTKAKPSSSEAIDAPVSDDYITKEEAKDYLRISLRTLGNKMKEPGFPIHWHNGRRPSFKRSELDAYSDRPKDAITAGNSSAPTSTSPLSDKTTVIAHVASLLAKAGHLDATGAARLSAWATSGCSTLPLEERIDWRTGRKTLCAFIVLAQHSSLISLRIGTKKKGTIGPLYEKSITTAFLDSGEIIKPGIDRTLSGSEKALAIFESVMTQFAQDRMSDPRYVDSLFGSVDDFFTNRSQQSFSPYLGSLEAEFEVGDKKSKVFSEIGIGMLMLFWDLVKERPELLSES